MTYRVDYTRQTLSAYDGLPVKTRQKRIFQRSVQALPEAIRLFSDLTGTHGKPCPSGRERRARTSLPFPLSSPIFLIRRQDRTVSACGEVARAGEEVLGSQSHNPSSETLRRKPGLVPLGSLVEAGTHRSDSGMLSWS